MKPRTKGRIWDAWRSWLHRVFNRCVGPWFYRKWYFEWIYRKPDPWNYAVNEYEGARYAELLSFVPLGGSPRVLEVGCAEGYFTTMVAQNRPATVLGIDVSSRALARARQRAAGIQSIEFERIDIRVQAPGGLFDVIFCCELLYYFADASTLARVRAHLLALLASNGALVVMHPWPASERFHGGLFGTCAELVLETRVPAQVGSRRPYEIAVYRRRPSMVTPVGQPAK